MLQRTHVPSSQTSTSTALILVVLAFAASSCNDECNRASDCTTGQVCYKGACTALSAEYVRCDTDRDCDESLLFACRAGRCTIRGSTVVTDAGLGMDGAATDGSVRSDASDATPSDATDAAPSDVGPEAGPQDALAGDAPSADGPSSDGPSGDGTADTGATSDGGGAAG